MSDSALLMEGDFETGTPDCEKLQRMTLAELLYHIMAGALRGALADPAHDDYLPV